MVTVKLNEIMDIGGWVKSLGRLKELTGQAPSI